jgi:hypothetical protein
MRFDRGYYVEQVGGIREVAVMQKQADMGLESQAMNVN